MEMEFTQLLADGARGYGWIAQDLNAEDAVRDASRAHRPKKAATADIGSTVSSLVAERDRARSHITVRSQCRSHSLT
jgi:hypothetical protein